MTEHLGGREHDRGLRLAGLVRNDNDKLSGRKTLIKVNDGRTEL